jgi:hypothetical protein
VLYIRFSHKFGRGLLSSPEFYCTTGIDVPQEYAIKDYGKDIIENTQGGMVNGLRYGYEVVKTVIESRFKNIDGICRKVYTHVARICIKILLNN